MRTFILEYPELAVASLTVRAVHSIFGGVVEVIRPPFGEGMNQALRDHLCSPDPDLLIVPAGALITTPFLQDLEQAIQSGQRAYLWADGQDCTIPAALWLHHDLLYHRRGKGPFPDCARLPFDSLVLDDILQHLNRLTSVQSISTSSSSRSLSLPRLPRWMKVNETRRRIIPILASSGTAAVSARPVVTIICPIYNDHSFWPWAVRSVLAQDHPGWELFIVDDGSDPPLTYPSSGLPQDPRIKLLRVEPNRGKAGALNVALKHVTAPYLLELDADDWLAPDCVSVIEEMTSDAPPSVALWTGSYVEWNQQEKREPLCQGIRMTEHAHSLTPLLERGIPPIPRVYRVEALQQIGGWSENGFREGRLYEDMDVSWRLGSRYVLEAIPQPFYHRRLRPASMTQRGMGLFPEWLSWQHRLSDRGG